MNFVRASVPFMTRCRELCTQYGALLVFDEVMTGFRVGLGSAQGVYAKQIPGFKPDMTVMGKVIGGGMPLAAFGGPRAIMEQLAPLGPVYQAGTLSRQPGGHRLRLGDAPANQQARLLRGPLGQDPHPGRRPDSAAAKAEGVPFSADCEGGMFGFFLLPELPQNYQKVMTSDGKKFNALFHGLLDRGVYIAPALYEAGFVSAAHTQEDIEQTLATAREVFKQMAG
jgi:glutamate-1-semialdehyde 2,1-aminomutase